MALVKRNEAGEIEAPTRTPSSDTSEVADPTSPEIVNFLFDGLTQEGDTDSWITADFSLARVVEDVVDVPIKKKLIEMTDFPIPAQHKLISRRGKRNDYAYLTEFFPADEDDDEELLA